MHIDSAYVFVIEIETLLHAYINTVYSMRKCHVIHQQTYIFH